MVSGEALLSGMVPQGTTLVRVSSLFFTPVFQKPLGDGFPCDDVVRRAWLHSASFWRCVSTHRFGASPIGMEA